MWSSLIKVSTHTIGKSASTTCYRKTVVMTQKTMGIQENSSSIARFKDRVKNCFISMQNSTKQNGEDYLTPDCRVCCNDVTCVMVIDHLWSFFCKNSTHAEKATKYVILISKAESKLGRLFVFDTQKT